MSQSLAIVIPAYKTKYLDTALASIAAQTNKNFKVYVCDDASKESIKSVVDNYASQLNIEYCRFNDNLGSTSLTRHWDRSVALADAEWVWLFSDDDILSEGCVEAFFDALRSTNGKHNIYRFNIEMIDAEGNVICVKASHPETERAYDFLHRRLLGKSLSAAVEYIFRKETFEKNGGFVSFPLAFCSDDASWIMFAGELDIYTIANGKVYWRSSNINISSVKGLHNKKIDAMVEYSVWLKARFKQLSANDIETWFFENLKYVYGEPGIVEKYRLATRLSSVFNKTKIEYCKKLFFNGVF